MGALLAMRACLQPEAEMQVSLPCETLTDPALLHAHLQQPASAPVLLMISQT